MCTGELLLSVVPIQAQSAITLSTSSRKSWVWLWPQSTVCVGVCVCVDRGHTRTVDWLQTLGLTQVFTMMPSSRVRECLNVHLNHGQLWAGARVQPWQHKEPVASTWTRLFNCFITIQQRLWLKLIFFSAVIRCYSFSVLFFFFSFCRQ